MASEIKLDTQREQRLKFGEAIFCANKLVSQIEQIIESATKKNNSYLFTRISKKQFLNLSKDKQEKLDFDSVSQTAYLGTPKKIISQAQVAVITAGTSDVPVGKEFVRTLRFYGESCLEIYDVGVAGIWRLMERTEDFKNMPVITVIAGMDAALPSVVGGLVSSLIIAVPTSTGYGVVNGGKTALFSILASCAPGILTVNIDNGYGAACATLRALNSFQKNS